MIFKILSFIFWFLVTYILIGTSIITLLLYSIVKKEKKEYESAMKNEIIRQIHEL